MPQLPVIVANERIRGQDVPSPGPDYFGQPQAQAAGFAAHRWQQVQDAQDLTESMRLTGEGTARLAGVLDDAKLNVADPEEYIQTVRDRIKETHDAVLESASNGRVKNRVQAELANNLIGAQTLAERTYFNKKKDTALGDLAIAQDGMAKTAAMVPDEASRFAIYDGFSRKVGQLAGMGFISDKDRQELVLKFDKDVLTRRGNALVRSAPESLLTALDEGQFDRLGEDQVFRLRESARTSMEAEQHRSDRIAKEVKEQAEQGWYSQLGTGQLKDADINDAIKGNNPYITPEKALQFQKHKAEGISGDKGPVSGIMSEYYISARSLPAIQRARQQLKALQEQTGPNEFINKAANELQSDQTTLENQGIARESNQVARDNRDIKNLQTEYDANRPAQLKALSNLFGNTATKDKAEIDRTYRQQGKDTAKELTGSKNVEQKNAVEAIPAPQRRVIEQVR